MTEISDKAVVSPKAKIGKDVKIFPFVYVEDDVEIGDNCIIFPGVNLLDGTRLGKNNKIHQNTVISAIPQDFAYRGDSTLCVIGDNNIIRENVVINRATFTEGKTDMGNYNYIMEGVHISHDSHLGNYNVMGYGTKVAGNVDIHNYIIFSSGVIANQGVSVGSCSMVEAGTRISKDVPPYIVVGGNPVQYNGVNSFIVEKMGISDKTKSHIANAYRLVFHGQDALLNVCAAIRQQIPDSDEIQRILRFLEASKLGIVGKKVAAE